MRTVSLLLLAALGGMAMPAAARAERTPAWLREYMAAYSARSVNRAHATIPAWARRYNMNCDGCHYPVPPRLNATGMRFKWAGYRMPDQIGEKVEVEKIQNYVAGHGVLQYEYTKTEGQSASNAFAVPEVGLFYGGPAGRSYSGFFEFERNPDGTTDLIAHVSTMWGKESAYGGFRVGQMHGVSEWGVAGFDRHVSVNDVAPLGTITSAIPFSFDTQLGLEGYVVTGSNRLSLQVTNGIDLSGSGTPGGTSPQKDVALVDQILYDTTGSGIEAVGYYGSLRGLDPAVAWKYSHFWRLGFTANKIYRNFELLGGVVYGKDFDLPASLAFTGNENKGVGYWVSGQYFIPSAPLVLFGRYEFVDPNTGAPNDAARHFIAGTVLPISLPQYLRWTLEYRLDRPQGGLPKTSDVVTELQLNF